MFEAVVALCLIGVPQICRRFRIFASVSPSAVR